MKEYKNPILAFFCEHPVVQNASKSFKIVQNLHPRAPVVRLVIFSLCLCLSDDWYM